jgi:hypothetical protein
MHMEITTAVRDKSPGPVDRGSSLRGPDTTFRPIHGPISAPHPVVAVPETARSVR